MSQKEKIPFVDLIGLHQPLESELLALCKKVIGVAGFIGGAEVEGFEKEFAQYTGTKHCVGVSSGTDALRFALMAAGVRPGDIVVTVPHTFIATTEAISQAGGRPDFVDIDKDTYTMDPEKLREYLELKCVWDKNAGRLLHRSSGAPVTAIIPVHLYGGMADMDPLLELAEQYRLIVVEDACQAHGAEYFSEKQSRWLKAGSIGRAAAFSFYPGKNLGACGEGGAITTNDAELARKSAMLRDHGSAKKYYHDLEGYNGRLDSIQAGMLRIKLRHLSEWNEERRKSARVYDEILGPMRESVTAPREPKYSKSVYHLYVVRSCYRDELQKHLNDAGIGTGIHYPIPLHLQTAYKAREWKQGDFPVSEEAANQILSLPMFPGLTEQQEKRVGEMIARFAALSAGVASTR